MDLISMDLNASPLPEEEEENYERHVDDGRQVDEQIETSVQTLRREREERIRKLRSNHDEGPPKRVVQHTDSTRSHEIKKSLPDGWLDCPSCGQNVDYLIPCKVPLDDSYNNSIPPGKRYSSKQVILQTKRQNREIGLVIDLTNTNKYYSPSEFTRQGIKYCKIPCKGRDSVPDNKSVNSFFSEVHYFLNRSRSHKRYILVHCTHGHNRTGYMLINYLMRTHPYNLTEAIQIFSAARPPGIYKSNYIDELYKNYHERKPEQLICPPVPMWKRSSDLDLNGEAAPDDETDPVLPLDDDIENKTMTNDDVLGDEIPYDQQRDLQLCCLNAFKLQGRQFPGSHPVSLDRDNLQLLRQRYYYATWKADGTRYMLLIATHGCYLIDRNFCFRRVQLRFPLKNPNEGSSHNFTLIDGEMVIDKLSTKFERRYLAYDLMMINGVSIVERPFSERWKLLEKEVFEPRNADRRKNSIYRYDMEPFRVRRKDFWLLSTVTKLLNEFIEGLSHKADGLIFQGWDDPYVPRTHECLLKWKYPHMNSVDFLFELGDGDCYLLFLFERGKKKLMDGSRVVFNEDDDVSALAGKIIECSWDPERKCWVCMRLRPDKANPNELNTYKKVMRSIGDNITEGVLLNEIAEIIQLPMYSDRIEKAHKYAQQQQQQRGKKMIPRTS